MPASLSHTATSPEARDAIIAACLKTYLEDDSPNFREELTDRLTLLLEALDHLENVTGTAALRDAYLTLKPLYGVIRLVLREAQMINALVEAMFQQQRKEGL